MDPAISIIDVFVCGMMAASCAYLYMQIVDAYSDVCDDDDNLTCRSTLLCWRLH